MRLATARRFALSLPEAAEAPHFEKSSFRVKGKIFATVPEGGRTLHIFVGPNEAQALVTHDPATFEEIRSAKNAVVENWVRVNLRTADGDQICELLEDAWRSVAPKRVVAAYDNRSAG